MPNTNQSGKRKREQNLIPASHKLTLEEQSNGGKASAKARAEKKLLKDEILKAMKDKDWEEMVLGIIARAKDSDKAFELLRDTIGQKPVTEIVADVDAEVNISVKLNDEV